MLMPHRKGLCRKGIRRYRLRNSHCTGEDKAREIQNFGFGVRKTESKRRLSKRIRLRSEEAMTQLTGTKLGRMQRALTVLDSGKRRKKTCPHESIGIRFTISFLCAIR